MRKVPICLCMQEKYIRNSLPLTNSKPSFIFFPSLTYSILKLPYYTRQESTIALFINTEINKKFQVIKTSFLFNLYILIKFLWHYIYPLSLLHISSTYIIVSFTIIKRKRKRKEKKEHLCSFNIHLIHIYIYFVL